VNEPQLSIVIPSCVRTDLLQRCLETVTFYAPPHTEVIVVDDASVGGCVSETAALFPSVRTLRLSRRSGFCVAANVGIRATTAPIIELLNDDTEVTAGWAEAALQPFTNPQVIAVAPLVLQLDPVRRIAESPLVDSAGDEYDRGGFARKRFHGVPLNADHKMWTSGPVWGVSATAGVYRRSALFDAGLFPEHFGAYFEDVDLSHRLRKYGEVWFEAASVVWHRVSASYGRKPTRRVLEQQSGNEERVFWRNTRGRALWSAIPRHVAVIAGKAIRRIQEGQFLPWSIGRLRVWCGG
jgi:GT2 family glycosyltransferase